MSSIIDSFEDEHDQLLTEIDDLKLANLIGFRAAGIAHPVIQCLSYFNSVKRNIGASNNFTTAKLRWIWAYKKITFLMLSNKYRQQLGLDQILLPNHGVVCENKPRMLTTMEKSEERIQRILHLKDMSKTDGNTFVAWGSEPQPLSSRRGSVVNILPPIQTHRRGSDYGNGRRESMERRRSIPDTQPPSTASRRNSLIKLEALHLIDHHKDVNSKPKITRRSSLLLNKSFGDMDDVLPPMNRRASLAVVSHTFK
jgi:hypothetical protein